MNCYHCGQMMDKPYAIWHWQSGKPAKNYCWLCWNQQMRGIQKIAPETVSFPRNGVPIVKRMTLAVAGIASLLFFAIAHFLSTTLGYFFFCCFKKATGIFKRETK